MANVTVGIKGDNKDFLAKVRQSQNEVKKLAGDARKSSGGITSAFRSSTRAAGRFGGLVAGGLGLGLITQGARAFGVVINDVMADARRQAALTRSAIASALDDTLAINLGGDRFTVESREQAVALGRSLRQELGRVQADLERNFSKLVNSSVIEGGLEKALAAGALLGLSEEQNQLFRLLTSQRDVLQDQVNKLEAATLQMTEQSKLAKRIRDEFGLASDEAKEIQKAQSDEARNNALRPNFSGPIDPTAGQSFQSFSNFGPLPPVEEIRDFIDPSITLEVLRLQKAIQAGVIPATQGMRQEASLLQQQLFAMLENGVNPANVQFQEMLQNMLALQEQAASASVEVQNLGGFIAVELGQEAAIAATELLLGFENLQSVLAGIKDLLRNIVAQIAAAAAKAAILSFLFPGAGGFGQLFKAGLGLVPFASGGIVTGPTPALVGEAGPEAIIPLDRLKSLGLQDNLVLETRVSGTDLLTMLRRTNTSRVGRGGPISI